MPKKTKTTKKTKKEPKLKKEDIIEENIPDENDLVSILAIWEFPEFIKHERGKLWYIGFTIIFLALLTYSYLSDNLLFAIILAIFAILYFTSGKDDPVTMETAITEDGIFIGNKFIDYEDLRSFYIIYYPPEIKNLYFETKSIIKQRIAIPLEGQDPVYIRELLLEYLDEDLEKEEIPASEGISRILKL